MIRGCIPRYNTKSAASQSPLDPRRICDCINGGDTYAILIIFLGKMCLYHYLFSFSAVLCCRCCCKGSMVAEIRNGNNVGNDVDGNHVINDHAISDGDAATSNGEAIASLEMRTCLETLENGGGSLAQHNGQPHFKIDVPMETEML